MTYRQQRWSQLSAMFIAALRKSYFAFVHTEVSCIWHSEKTDSGESTLGKVQGSRHTRARYSSPSICSSSSKLAYSVTQEASLNKGKLLKLS